MKKIPLFILFGLAIFLNGCASMEKINEEYGMIQYADGINQKEAKLIAQVHLMESRYTSSFDPYKADIITTPETLAHRNLWFVDFPAQDTLSDTHHLVIVDKRTGGILRSRPYTFQYQTDYDWALK